MKRYRNRKVLYVIFSILIVCVFSLTLVYAALSTVLNIGGQAEVQSAKWDIHFENIFLRHNSVNPIKKATIKSPTEIEFSIKLEKPGDFYEFTTYIVNKGTIDAMITGIVKTPTLTPTQQKYLTYEVNYADGTSINENHLLVHNSQKEIRVKVLYKKDITASDLPQTTETLNLGFEVIYGQSNDQGVAASNGPGDVITNLVRMTSGNIESPQIGDMFCIKEECFHVISSTSDTVTGLAQYNLYVGGYYDNDFISYGTEATGIQNELMTGYADSSSDSGLILFSDENTHGVKMNSYEGSIIKNSVDDYKSILESYGVSINNARIMLLNEMETLTAEDTGESIKYLWLYRTSYFLDEPNEPDYIYYAVSFGGVSSFMPEDQFENGIRPVITINKSLF